MIKFSDKIKDIDRLIELRRSKWKLANLLAFEDLAQILRIHINKKFELWDQQRPFDPWCSSVIKHQTNNQIRNLYGRLTPPCIQGSEGCPFNTGEGCKFTASGRKDSGCPAYAKWEKSKKNAYELKIAAPLEDYDGATHEADFDIVESVAKFHVKMKSALTERMYQAYQYLYMENLTDEEVALKLGFKTREKNRCPGYRQISNMKSDIFKTAKEVIEQFDL